MTSNRSGEKKQLGLFNTTMFVIQIAAIAMCDSRSQFCSSIICTQWMLSSFVAGYFGHETGVLLIALCLFPRKVLENVLVSFCDHCGRTTMRIACCSKAILVDRRNMAELRGSRIVFIRLFSILSLLQSYQRFSRQKQSKTRMILRALLRVYKYRTILNIAKMSVAKKLLSTK